MKKPCCIEGCDKPHHGHGYCVKHWGSWRKYGDPLEVERRALLPKVKEICSVEGCEREAYCRGWCHKHYTRWRVHGDPTFNPYLDENPKELSEDGTYYTLKDRNGIEFLVDVEDYDKIKHRVWICNSRYMVASINGKGVKLHRFLLGEPPEEGLVVDHKNRNTTDNRRNNLHWVTSSENSLNKRFENCDHVHKVSHNKTNPYTAQFSLQGKTYRTTYFPTYEEAKEAVEKLKKEVGYYNTYWENIEKKGL